MAKTNPAAPVRVIEETPAYWRVVFDYPPFNIVDATIFEGLQDLLVRMDTSQSLRVVVFESANPDFYLAHFDLTGKTGNITTAVGPSGLPILMDTFVRLTTSPVVSIAKIRGCVRGASSEFVLACDMRFASRENTRLGQPEVGVGVHPGGGGTERLPHLVGRGRALEIILGANDFDGDTAERYGYVNRALPDAELDGFVDALARRIASFDRRAIAAAKNLVNQVSLPSADRLLDAITSFETALTWPEAQQRIQALLERGLQRDIDFEKAMARGARHARRDQVEVWQRAPSPSGKRSCKAPPHTKPPKSKKQSTPVSAVGRFLLDIRGRRWLCIIKIGGQCSDGSCMDGARGARGIRLSAKRSGAVMYSASVVAWRVTSVAMQPLWPLALM